MKVLIASPTAGGIVTAAYVSTVAYATIALNEIGAKYTYVGIDGADVVMARNLLANCFIDQPDNDQILFLDSDMSVGVDVFQAMLRSNHDMVGGIYSQRRLDLESYGESRVRGLSHSESLALACDFDVSFLSKQITVQKGFFRVRGAGFGCMLIKRNVFERLIERNVVSEYVSPRAKAMAQSMGVRAKIYDFFSEIELPDGDRLSEDLSFCERVNQLGDVEIWGFGGKKIGHVGHHVFGAPYIDQLVAKKSE